MTSRRNFLGVSAAAAASAALSSSRAGAMVPAPIDDPPAIAALKSMRDKAIPITVPERQGRLERARGLMRAAKLDAMGPQRASVGRDHPGEGKRVSCDAEV